jgi:beta-glucosidase
MHFSFPPGFMLGVSSAATQIEGGAIQSSWQDWYDKGHIKDGTSPATADDHWNRWQEDADLMASLGISAYRLGVEWARLIPQPGQPDAGAIDHYRKELIYLREKGIRPLITIHHFTNPVWFEAKGGFLNRDNLEDYLELVKVTVQSFGDLVSEYITINEPNVYATNGFCFGCWPPGKTSYRETFQVLSNLAYCHIKAYEMIHRLRKEMGYTDTMVGFANHLRVFQPENTKNLIHRALAKMAEWLFQGALTRAACLGEFYFPLTNFGRLPKGEYADFHGVNYYTRSTVKGLKDGVRTGSPRNDLGWEIYPKGIVTCSQKLVSLLNRPVWVTENGTCDQSDGFRARYIAEHLDALLGSGLPFERYYHWCFCDNFEWLEGQSARFGLVYVDYDTQKRTVKNSGTFYREMISAGGMTEGLFDQYVSGEEYRIL